MKRFLLILLFVISSSSWALVQTQLDTSQVAKGESFNLTFNYQGNASGVLPDFSVLEKDFEILGSSKSSQVSIINGKVNALTQWALTLSAKKTGTLTIPAIKFGKDQSQPIKVQVEKQSAVQSNQEVFFQISVDDKKPFVQSQVIYKAKLFYSKPLSGGDYREPQAKNAMLMRIGKSRSYQATMNNRLYQVIEQDYALFPQKSGKITIQAPIFNGAVRILNRNTMDYFQSEVRQPISVTADDIDLNVKPVPASFDADDWIPAKSLEISQQFSGLDQAVKVGSPITRIISLKVTGLSAEQLPDFKFTNSDDVSVYPEKAETKNSFTDDDVVGTKTIKIVYIPSQAGEIKIPEFKVKWFNTNKQKAQEAVLDEKVITVAGASKSKSKATPSIAPQQEKIQAPKPSSDKRPWIIAALFACAWIITMVYFMWRRRQSENGTNKNFSKKTLKQACLANDAKKSEQELLQWASQHWQGEKFFNLSDIANRVRDKAFKQELQRLQKILYSPHREKWSGEALWRCVSNLGNKDAKKSSRNNPLPPMNPVS